MTSPYLQLTVADHEAGAHGAFVPIARWSVGSVSEGLRLLSTAERAIEAPAAVGEDEAPFAFILDLFESPTEHVGECGRAFGLQLAASLARDGVMAWLDERPDDDAASRRRGVYLGAFPSEIFGEAA